MEFLLFLVVASLIGTILWIIQNTIKLITQKFFSQTWHYYTSLIPVFFLLGGTKITSMLIRVIASALDGIGA